MSKIRYRPALKLQWKPHDWRTFMALLDWVVLFFYLFYFVFYTDLWTKIFSRCERDWMEGGTLFEKSMYQWRLFWSGEPWAMIRWSWRSMFSDSVVNYLVRGSSTECSFLIWRLNPMICCSRSSEGAEVVPADCSSQSKGAKFGGL